MRITYEGKSRTEIFDWTTFWKSNETGWFGQYGFLGKARKKGQKIDNYGETLIEIENSQYRIEQAVYDGFSNTQIKIAVIETMRFIRFALDRRAENEKEES